MRRSATTPTTSLSNNHNDDDEHDKCAVTPGSQVAAGTPRRDRSGRACSRCAGPERLDRRALVDHARVVEQQRAPRLGQREAQARGPSASNTRVSPPLMPSRPTRNTATRSTPSRCAPSGVGRPMPSVVSMRNWCASTYQGCAPLQRADASAASAQQQRAPRRLRERRAARSARTSARCRRAARCIRPAASGRGAATSARRRRRRRSRRGGGAGSDRRRAGAGRAAARPTTAAGVELGDADADELREIAARDDRVAAPAQGGAARSPGAVPSARERRRAHPPWRDRGASAAPAPSAASLATATSRAIGASPQLVHGKSRSPARTSRACRSCRRPPPASPPRRRRRRSRRPARPCRRAAPSGWPARASARIRARPGRCGSPPAPGRSPRTAATPGRASASSRDWP